MTRAHSVGARSGVANFRPNLDATVARAGLISTRVTSADANSRQTSPVNAPTTPAPTTATRPKGPGPASKTEFSAVSMLAASTAREAGTFAGTGTAAATGKSNTV